MDGAHYVPVPVTLTLAMIKEDGIIVSAHEAVSLFNHVFQARVFQARRNSPAEQIFQTTMTGQPTVIAKPRKQIDRVITSDENVRRMQATQFLESLVFIDGKAWQRRFEPKIAVSFAPGPRYPTLEIETIYDNDMERPSFGLHVKPDWLDVQVYLNLSDEVIARNLLLEMGAVYSKAAAQALIGNFTDLVIHDPHAFSFDGHPARMRELGRDVAKFLRLNIGYSDENTVRAWIELAEKTMHASDADAEDIEALLVDLIPKLEDDEQRSKAENQLNIARITNDLLEVASCENPRTRGTSAFSR
jgi:transposase-like protein